MQDFKMSGASMNEIQAKLKLVQEEIDASYDALSQLLSSIESEKQWKGKQETAFMAYMGLMQQYHKSFSNKNGENPVQQAIDGLEAHGTRVDEFYSGFQEYKDVEGME